MHRTKLQFAICIVSFVFLWGCSGDQPIVRSEERTTSPEAININAAGADELQRIPNIGEKLAADIIEFRQKHGPFRRPEHLLLIQGISDRRFREIRHLVRVD